MCRPEGTGFIYVPREASPQGYIHRLVMLLLLKWIAKLDRMLYAYLFASTATPEAPARSFCAPLPELSRSKDQL